MKVPFLDLAAMHAEVQADLDRAWQQVSRSGGFIGGALVERFEADFAAYCGSRFAVGLASGTAALEVALRALEIGRGDQVILPTNTFIATASAVQVVGATPVFIDIDPRTLLMTADGVEAALTRRTRAVIAVHLYGQPVDIDALRRLTARAGIALIEDAAQAHGATWRGRRVGSLGDLACFSFYPGKNLGAFGDAGAITTNDRDLATRIRSLSNHGRAPDAHHLHTRIGGNHRLDALQAALLGIKLRRLDAWNTARRQAATWYQKRLQDLPVQQVEQASGAGGVHHLQVVQVEQRERVRQALFADGIASAIHYPIPCHGQPAFAEMKVPPLPVAERAAGRVLSLPMFPHLSEAMVDQVVTSLERALGARRSPRRLAS